MTGESSSATSGFLAAEKAAEYLVDSLRRLDDESGRYSAAAGTLGQLGDDVRELAGRTAELAGRTTEAVEALRGVGAAQVLERLGDLGQRLTEQAQAVDDLRARIAGQDSRLDSLSASMRDLEARIAALGDAQRTVAAEIKSTLDERAAEFRKQTGAVALMARWGLVAAAAAALLAALAAILTRV